MARKKLTRKNARKVVETILTMEDKDLANYVLTKFNEALDEIREGDGFGTEAQLDPRGDGREE